ncbi:MAG: tRNA (N(6)-L-threonylcarbamoyladenosine(37)-C(2))-methylthiotransferase MtaB [Turicibacter sp.]|nr:tRNA (N(6)-L-threonylcarbamoyladenosine(37)-C(2))-methylthiotransferase MtaB [Turicibacter sp.]
MTVSALTLGCKVNQYDTDRILADFAALGFTICDSGEHADIYIINTCTVTNISSKKSRQAVNKIHTQNPTAFIVAYGCYAQMEPDALKSISDIVIGTDKRGQVAKIVADIVEPTARKPPNPVKKPKRTRAYLKIQDGCDNFCAYCIVPFARGSAIKRNMQELKAEVDAIARQGNKEIIITGTQISSFGHELIELLEYIDGIKQIERIRLSSLEPTLINDAFLVAISEMPKLCDHFHLSLQSGSDAILASMNRKYTVHQFLQAAESIRRYYPKAAITTDIIVGFPNESETDFNRTLTVASEVKFAQIHVFQYSPKKGTAAATFANQINSAIKEERSKILRKLAQNLSCEFYKSHIDATLPVLFEKFQNGVWEGHTTNYLTVRVVCDKNSLENSVKMVKIAELKDNAAYGSIV